MGREPSDAEKHEPSLELPSLRLPGLGRKRAAPPDRDPNPDPDPGPAAAPGGVVATGTGLVVGLVGSALTYGALRGCDAARGTESCGGPGFFLLVAIFIVMVLLGAVLLKGGRVAEATSTSFLAVGVVGVVVLAALLDVVFSPWMFVVVPLVTAAAYLLSHWVTSRLAGPAGPGS